MKVWKPICLIAFKCTGQFFWQTSSLRGSSSARNHIHYHTYPITHSLFQARPSVYRPEVSNPAKYKYTEESWIHRQASLIYKLTFLWLRWEISGCCWDRGGSCPSWSWSGSWPHQSWSTTASSYYGCWCWGGRAAAAARQWRLTAAADADAATSLDQPAWAARERRRRRFGAICLALGIRGIRQVAAVYLPPPTVRLAVAATSGLWGNHGATGSGRSVSRGRSWCGEIWAPNQQKRIGKIWIYIKVVASVLKEAHIMQIFQVPINIVK